LYEKWSEILDNDAVWAFDTAVINGEVKPANILFLDDDVSSILVWSNVQKYDPAYDLAGVAPALLDHNREVFYQTYRKLSNKLQKNTRLDANLEVRAEFHAQFELASKLLLAHRAGDNETVSIISEEFMRIDEKMRLSEALDEVEQRQRQRDEIISSRAAELSIIESQETERLNNLQPVTSPVLPQHAAADRATTVGAHASQEEAGDINDATKKPFSVISQESTAAIPNVNTEVMDSDAQTAQVKANEKSKTDIEKELEDMLLNSNLARAERDQISLQDYISDKDKHQ
jgi:hypothetical protein